MAISREEALDCFRSDDLIGIGMEADAVRRRLHPEGVVSYVVEGTIDCGMGAGDGEAGLAVGFEKICGLVGETLQLGGTSVVLRGGVGPEKQVAEFEGLLREIKRRFPGVWLSGMSAPDLLAIADGFKLRLRDLLLRLREAGLDSIAGDGAENMGTEAWVEVHRAAHAAGMPTAATMVFGGEETLEQRVDFLEAVGQLQQATGGFTAFVPVSFRATGGGRELDEATAVERLKMLAISRMMLDNVENVQVSTVGQGPKVSQMGLRFGGNDVGSVAVPDNSGGSSEEDLRRVIRDAGFRPVRRDAAYRTAFLD